jgi:hypothetical protein
LGVEDEEMGCEVDYLVLKEQRDDGRAGSGQDEDGAGSIGVS